MVRLYALVAAGLAALSAPAFAQSGVKVGVLECGGGTSVGYVIGSSAAFNCVFRPSGGRGGETYAATVGRVGLDIGWTNFSAVEWAVFAPSRSIGKGALAGRYGGVSANAAVGIGGGANALVGGSRNSISLQPVSVQGQTGLNLAAGVSGLELRATGASKRTVKRTKKLSKNKRS